MMLPATAERIPTAETAREEGREAALRGAPFHHNPYPLGSSLSREWSAGHREMNEARG